MNERDKKWLLMKFHQLDNEVRARGLTDRDRSFFCMYIARSLWSGEFLFNQNAFGG